MDHFVDVLGICGWLFILILSSLGRDLEGEFSDWYLGLRDYFSPLVGLWAFSVAGWFLCALLIVLHAFSVTVLNSYIGLILFFNQLVLSFIIAVMIAFIITIATDIVNKVFIILAVCLRDWNVIVIILIPLLKEVIVFILRPRITTTVLVVLTEVHMKSVLVKRSVGLRLEMFEVQALVRVSKRLLLFLCHL